ncbi:hypothetical protein BYT27DRAFT_7258125 [Phlegmacium glaucopus]|nr:hypothetical protein BYT27DRAFT_7258125 [Phlegmacium glaucopus]
MVESSDVTQGVLGSMFIGTAVSLILHGITCGQVIWYFRFQPEYGLTSKRMKALIWFIWLAETFNCVFMSAATLHGFLSPAITRANMHSDSCRHWSGTAQGATSAMCTFSVEGFFIMRMWRLSERKKLTALVVYVLNHIVEATSHLFLPPVHSPSAPVRRPAFPGSLSESKFPSKSSSNPKYGVTLLSQTIPQFLYLGPTPELRLHAKFQYHKDCARAYSMVDFNWHVDLALRSAIPVFCILPQANFGFFYVRAGVYTNAMLAQLNARTRFRRMADATLPLDSLNLSSTSSAQRVHPELQSVRISIISAFVEERG